MQASREIGTLLLSGKSETGSKNSKRIKGNFSSVFSKTLPHASSKNVDRAQQVPQQKLPIESNIASKIEAAKPAKKTESINSDVSEELVRSKKTKASNQEAAKETIQKSPQDAVVIPVQFSRRANSEQVKNDTAEDEKRSLKKIEKQDSQISQWTIIDQRKQKNQTQSANNATDMPVKQDAQKNSRQEAELVVSIRQEQNFQQESSIGQAGSVKNEHQSFAEVLTRHLEGASQEIVKTAQVVLQDNDSGIIRLRLEPETLGGVKIELKLAEKKISGTIVVESDVVQAAFKDSYAALRDAFNSQGFELTQLDINVGNGNSNADNYADKKPIYDQHVKKIEQAVPEAVSSTPWTLSSGLTVNLVI